MSNLSPCEKRLADLDIDVWTKGYGDDDECHWRGTLIDRMETKINNLLVDIKNLSADLLETRLQLEEKIHDATAR